MHHYWLITAEQPFFVARQHTGLLQSGDSALVVRTGEIYKAVDLDGIRTQMRDVGLRPGSAADSVLMGHRYADPTIMEIWL